MGSQLHQVLRSLCFNTEWKYAVFWKLQHRARMMLTWEDAYYDSRDQHDLLEKRRFSKMVGNLHDDRYSHDPLELAVAKMSYHVYSLGEGVVGQVAVTRKHQWLSVDNHVTDSRLPFRYFDGWQSQFSAGIRTVAVVAVVPHGVVQLGSLNKIPEDLKMVNYIKDVFFQLRDSYVMQCSMDSSCQSDLTTRSSGLQTIDDCLLDLDKTMNNDGLNIWSSMFQLNVKPGDDSHLVPLHSGYSEKATNETINNGGSEGKDTTRLADISCYPPLDNDNQNGAMYESRSSEMDASNTSFRFSGGCELYEALGSAFIQPISQNNLENEFTENETVIDFPENMGSDNTLLMENSGSEHLLEAVVANACHSTTDANNKKSLFSKSTNGSECYSGDCSSVFEEAKLHCLNSLGASSIRSSKSFSSRSQSECTQEPVRVNKKRSRAGENCRPRPRDRQLIQDRIKELRELVPNGSKCSIDSLLDRTIKHMLFMQGITKHGDKLNKCNESKLLDKEIGKGRVSGYDQGSSWAVEVGSHQKICPIIVENMNIEGQMLIEMLCGDCAHFLEIAEAIRSLGLTILKARTEAYGKKTWISFVVEGKNNRSMHRMDVLWSLVQILQSGNVI